MYILNKINALKKMTIKELRDFIYEHYDSRTGFTKENNYYSMKRQEKMISF